MPRNAVTTRQYSGINVLILWTSAQAMGFTSSRWLTFNQARDAGGNVRKGEKGTAIVYASTFVPESERAKGDDAKSVAFLKTFVVFNLDQIDGLDALRGSDVAPTECETVAAGEALIAAQGIEIRHGGDRAYYAPSQDIIAIPHHAAFHEPINYYRTAFHELGHATGHKSRLDRKILNEFGSKDYAKEELVAEMSSAFVCASLGIIPTVRHADYIGAWLSVLREDNKAVFRAASQASRAADWLLARGGGRADDVFGRNPSWNASPCESRFSPCPLSCPSWRAVLIRQSVVMISAPRPYGISLDLNGVSASRARPTRVRRQFGKREQAARSLCESSARLSGE